MEIEKYLDSIGEKSISLVDFEFLASRVPTLPTPALQMIDSMERMAAKKMFDDEEAAAGKTYEFNINCTVIMEEGQTVYHDDKVPEGVNFTINIF